MIKSVRYEDARGRIIRLHEDGTAVFLVPPDDPIDFASMPHKTGLIRSHEKDKDTHYHGAAFPRKKFHDVLEWIESTNARNDRSARSDH